MGRRKERERKEERERQGRRKNLMSGYSCNFISKREKGREGKEGGKRREKT